MHQIITHREAYMPHMRSALHPMQPSETRGHRSLYEDNRGSKTVSQRERKEATDNREYERLVYNLAEVKVAPMVAHPIFLPSQYGPQVQVQDFWNTYSTSSVAQRSKSRQSQPSSINRLPPEVLGDIFEFCLEGWNCVSVESLMAISGTWMVVCLETPALWTKLILYMTNWTKPNLYEMRSNYVYHHLSRSGILPMRVVVNLAPLVQHEVMAREHVRLGQAVVHLLSTGGPTGKGANHWSSLEVSFNEATPRRLLDFLGTSMGRLCELTVASQGESRLPIMQIPTLRHLSTIGRSPISGYSPERLKSLALVTTSLSSGEMNQLANCTKLERLSLTFETTDRHLPKITLPHLKTLEIIIKHSQAPCPSDQPPQLPATEPISLRALILPRLRTLIVTGDNSSLIAIATLRNLNQVLRLELKQWEFLATTSRRTQWGFLAYSVIQTPSMAWNPSSSVVEYVLSQCTGLEEFQGFPGAVKLLNRIVQSRPDLRPCLRLLQSKHQGVLKTVQIKDVV